MNKCCENETKLKESCPSCKNPGKAVPLITLKALLKPDILNDLDTVEPYFFCSSSDCSVVYFNSIGTIYNTDDLKVSVFQKEKGEEVPACYCFGWTRKKISGEIHNSDKSSAIESIKKNIQAGRCACEINNPQGSCCLGNVSQYVKETMGKLGL